MKSFLKRKLGIAVAHLTSSVEKTLLQPKMVDILGQTQLASLDVRRFAQLRAAWDAAEIYNRFLYNVEYFPDYIEHLKTMASRAVALGEGHLMEFGVASGTSIRAIATTGRRVIGFDSFKGLPEDWREGARTGAFACSIPTVPSNVELRIGMIEETLPAFLSEHAGPIRLLHIDTDLYAPARFILTACKSRMLRTIVVFDEFFNYPGWEDHEYKALTEFLRENPEFSVKYLGLGGAVAVSVLLERAG